MASLRPLRGGCQCGRNRYIIDIPADAVQTAQAQVLFDTDSVHRIPLATPLSAFLRVPLAWYRSTTYSFYPDETHASIRRVFESHSPAQRHAKRCFCGFCGTPLSYWTEEPRSEAGYIQLTLASLRGEDLGDLEDMGLLPGDGDGDSVEEKDEDERGEEQESTPMDTDEGAIAKGGTNAATSVRQRVITGTPWLHALVDGSRLGNMRRSKGIDKSEDGNVRVEWEIVEWTEGDGDLTASTTVTSSTTTAATTIPPTLGGGGGGGEGGRELEDAEMSSSSGGERGGKRKLRDRGDSDV